MTHFADRAQTPGVAQAGSGGNRARRSPPGLLRLPSAPVRRMEPTLPSFAASAAEETEPSPVPNRTGLPDALKSGVEAHAGLAMDDVRVHRNSPEPAKFGALAFARGSEIHLGPGQERHLPHEAWHVVQQKQGRVRATRQMKGALLNEEEDLEAEADLMAIRVVSGSASRERQSLAGAVAGPRLGATGALQLQKPVEGSKPHGKDVTASADPTKAEVKYDKEFPIAGGPVTVTLGASVTLTVQHTKIEKIKDALGDLTKAEAKKGNSAVSSQLQIELKDVLSFWTSGALGDLVKSENFSSSVSTEFGLFEVSTQIKPTPPTIESTFKPKKAFELTDAAGFKWSLESKYVLKAVANQSPPPQPRYAPETSPGWVKTLDRNSQKDPSLLPVLGGVLLGGLVLQTIATVSTRTLGVFLPIINPNADPLGFDKHQQG